MVKTTCLITEDFLWLEEDWWQVWLRSKVDGKWVLYADARAVDEAVTGYRGANSDAQLNPTVREDIEFVKKAKRERPLQPSSWPTIEQLQSARMNMQGYRQMIMRPCPKCATMWPLMFVRCRECEAQFLFGAAALKTISQDI